MGLQQPSALDNQQSGATTASAEKPFWKRALRSLWRYKPGLFGLILLLLFVFVAALAPWLAPHDPIQGSTGIRLKPPGHHVGATVLWLGSDSQGRDVLSRLIYGSRVSLTVGLGSALLGGGVGLILGLVAGYLGGVWDAVIMRIADVQLAFPRILLAMFMMAILGSNTFNVILVIAISSWVIFARVVRSVTLTLKESEFVQAARALGAGHWHIMLRHILPNTLAPLIVVASFQVAAAIVLEASLGFLGFGVPLPDPTWGNMIGTARTYLYVAWWIPVFPGVAMLLSILAVNLVGDWLRLLFDPKAKYATR